MPATSGRQYRFMQAAAHGMGYGDISQSVAKEFVHATPPAKRSEWSHKPSKIKKKKGSK